MHRGARLPAVAPGRCSAQLVLLLPPPAFLPLPVATPPRAQALYDACPGWGWSEAKKRAELADLQARFVVVFREGEQEAQPAQQAHQAQQAQQLDAVQPPAAAAGQENQAAAGNGAGRGGDGCGAGLAVAAEPVAFLHFRFEEEEGEAVLYCYEVQAAAEVQVGPPCSSLGLQVGSLGNLPDYS